MRLKSFSRKRLGKSVCGVIGSTSSSFTVPPDGDGLLAKASQNFAPIASRCCLPPHTHAPTTPTLPPIRPSRPSPSALLPQHVRRGVVRTGPLTDLDAFSAAGSGSAGCLPGNAAFRAGKEGKESLVPVPACAAPRWGPARLTVSGFLCVCVSGCPIATTSPYRVIM